MRRIFFGAAAALLLAAPGAVACDFCDCLFGINPYYSTMDRIGVNVLLQRSTSVSPTGGGGILKLAAGGAVLFHSGTTETGVPSTEYRTTFDITLQHHFSEHWMMTARLPVNITRVRTDHVLDVRGIGDPSLMLHWVTTARPSPGMKATFLVGAGVDLPLGSSGLVHPDGDRIDPRLQPGSGSVDVLAGARAALQLQDWTVGVDLSGRWATANRYDDRMGTAFAATASAGYDVVRSNEDQFAIVGIGALRLETAGADRVGGVLDPSARHTSLYMELGTECAWRDIRIRASVAIPVYDHRAIVGEAEQARVTAGLSYDF